MTITDSLRNLSVLRDEQFRGLDQLRVAQLQVHRSENEFVGLDDLLFLPSVRAEIVCRNPAEILLSPHQQCINRQHVDCINSLTLT
jgi:hypothetical protein